MSRRVAVIIEDDADIRNLLEAILSQAGFVCYTAATGAEGIASIREHEPIVTTLDISLPGIDGFEVGAADPRVQQHLHHHAVGPG